MLYFQFCTKHYNIATAEQLKDKFDHLPIFAEFEIPRQLNLTPAYDGYIVHF